MVCITNDLETTLLDDTDCPSIVTGPVNELFAMAGLPDSLYKDSLYSTSSPGRSVLSRNRSRLFDGASMYSSEPDTVAPDDSLIQPYQAQALMYPLSAASSSYDADMSHTIADHPGQLATNFPPDPQSQLARPIHVKRNPSVVPTDGGRRSCDTKIDEAQVHARSHIRSHSKDKVKWSCTVCEHDTFRGKPEWIRHERNQHFPRHIYYCQPDIIVKNTELYCVACKIKNPGCSHIAKRDAHACALKNLSARRFASKERFIKHIRSHELPSDCRQLEEWKRLLPEQVWGCGFCVKVFDNVDERLFHISRHFERGMTRADWDPSRVVLSLLTLPYIANEWVLRLHVELGVEYYDQAWPEIAWSKEDAMVLQRRVTSGQESGTDLAESAFSKSIVGREIQRRKQLGFTSLEPGSSAGYQPLST